MKECIDCKKEKDLNEFHKQSKTCERRKGRCKECYRANQRKQHVDNRDDRLKKMNDYAKPRKLLKQEYDKKRYRSKKPSVIKNKLHNEKYKRSPEQRKEADEKYKRENKEKIRESKAKWYQENKYILKLKRIMK